MESLPISGKFVFDDWWDISRQGIHRWLDGYSKPLAEIYCGSVRLLAEHPPGWTRFVAHGMREIVNRLPGAVCGEVKGRVEYSAHVDKIAALWEQSVPPVSPPNTEDAPIDEVRIVLDPSLRQAFEALLEEHRDGVTRNRERALTMVQALVPEGDGDAQRMRMVAMQWVEVGNWAHRWAHDQTRPDDVRDASEVVRHFEELEGVLLGVTRLFFENKGDIDALLDSTNS